MKNKITLESVIEQHLNTETACDEFLTDNMPENATGDLTLKEKQKEIKDYCADKKITAQKLRQALLGLNSNSH